MRAGSSRLLLFGATGDLAQRMLLPSLFGLHVDGLLPKGMTITCTARSDKDDEGYCAIARGALASFLPKDRENEGAIASFLERLAFQAFDASDTGGFLALKEKPGDI